MENKIYKGVNWNTSDNDYALMFWEQNIKQFWIDSEYIPSKDLTSWKSLSSDMKLAYMKALGGLTMLDTLQSTTGMPKIIDHVESLQNKSVLSYMCMMEAIHAKSYSTIFTTVATTEQINDTFKWVEENKYLQYKAKKIDAFYRDVDSGDEKDLYKALASSVMLESFLFYSGFFLPLWLCGNGQMVASADIIKKIVADESIHGVFVGLLAQDLLKKFSEEDKKELIKFVYDLLEELIQNEFKYTEDVYSDIGLTPEVKNYVRYNANKALMNLGFDPLYEHVVVNPIVLNGLKTDTTQHDFFSKKSTNYEKALEVVYLKDDDFKFPNLKK